MYELYIDGVLFPVTPGSLNIKINNKNKTITLINEGEVNLIKWGCKKTPLTEKSPRP